MNERITAPDAPDEETPLDPAAAMALLTTQQRSVQYQQSSFVWVILLGWGIAWSVGFLALWLIDGARPGFALPLPVAVGVFIALTVTAIVLSMVLGIRSGKGVKASRANAFQGTVYGFTWTVSMVGIWLFGSGLTYNGMDPDLLSIFYPSAYVLMTGVLYFVSAALWGAKPMLFLGAWLVLIAVVAPFIGYPNHYLFFAIAGGGALLAMAIVAARYTASLRRSMSGSNSGSVSRSTSRSAAASNSEGARG
jgi:hypothetical protein